MLLAVQFPTHKLHHQSKQTIDMHTHYYKNNTLGSATTWHITNCSQLATAVKINIYNNYYMVTLAKYNMFGFNVRNLMTANDHQ